MTDVNEQFADVRTERNSSEAWQRATHPKKDMSFFKLVGVTTWYAMLKLCAEVFSGSEGMPFNEYALSSFAGEIGIAAACAVLISRFNKTISSQKAYLSIIGVLSAYTIVNFFIFKAMNDTTQLPYWSFSVVWTAVAACALIAAFITGFRLAKDKAITTAVFVAIGTLLTQFSLPQIPMIKYKIDDPYRVDLSQLIRMALAPTKTNTEEQAENTVPRPEVDWERVMYAQTALIAKTLSSIQSNDASKPHAYFIGMAPFSRQDVFKRELAASTGIFETHFNAKGRTLLLQNHPDTAETLPLASVTNLQKVADGLKSKINAENDMVVLFVTSHGSVDSIAVDAYPLPLNHIKPADVKDALARTGAKHRVVIISACHSGSFIDDLRDDNTIIITAAREDRTSFGCSNESEWTYFTNALFNHGLHQSRDLKASFEIAKKLVAEWETKAGVQVSEPQMHVGRNAEVAWSKLMPYFDSTVSESLPTPETTGVWQKVDLGQ
jgi:hypothetical protein